jgi:S-formylglutathione hydrolase FrmB
MRNPILAAARLAVVSLVLTCMAAVAQAEDGGRFQVSFSRAVESGPITGRLIVLVSRTAEPELRKRLSILVSPAVFGIDVEAARAGTTMIVDASATGYPMENLRKLPAGEYYVQALLIRYTQMHRADGHTVWMPLAPADTFFIEQPGNLYSKVQKTRLDPERGYALPIDLTETVVAEPAEPDTQWLKTVRIKSKVLSDFWGVPMYIGARVLLPRDFDAHPKTRYPGVYVFGHGTPFFFKTDQASHEPELAHARSANLQTGYEFYQTWNGERFPRVVAICPWIPSPFGIESYALNSVNTGPWGDAITQELIPYLEKKFRLIAEPYARIVEGASTGGWETLALQLHYPDFFGGAWVFNPDPIDFSRYQLNDIYKDENMFALPSSEWTQVERPFKRTREGQPLWSMREWARFEAVLGSKGRSNYQLDMWQATYGPVGPDGYPVLLFDKLTGVINKDVANYMREHGYDLTEYTRRNWATLGPKINGKLNFFAGEQDDFFLNLAVYNYEDMLKQQDNPKAVVRFEYGRPKKGHSWHLTDFSEMVREMATHVQRQAPAAAKVEDWNY